MKSIRTFLIIVILSTVTLMAFLSALNGYQDSMAKAEQLFDSELVDKSHLLLQAFLARTLIDNKIDMTSTQPLNATVSENSASLIKDIELENEQMAAENNFFAFQIWHQGNLLLRSSHAPQKAIAHFEKGFNDSNFLNHRWRTYSYYNNTSNLWILTAERTDIRYVLAENIILDSILPVVIMLPLLGILIWTIVSFGLSPLRKLAKELGNKRVDDLSPLSIDEQPIELIQVVNSTNDLLKRLKSSFLREKRFASDAAHELRTPISAIKIHLHNLAAMVPENEHSFLQLKSSVDRMGHLVEQILNLNRTSPDQYISRFNTIDLYKLAQELIIREYPQFNEKNIQLALEGEPCNIEGDPFALEVLLQNLMTNACKYTPDGGSVIVTISEKQTDIQLQIQDSGPGVPKEQYERVFDRFYRLNGDSHDSGTMGCGLGLAIVQQIVELHQAKITLGHSSFSSGLLVNIIFPKEPSARKQSVSLPEVS